MPAIDSQSCLIDKQAPLEELCGQLAKRPIIAMDTEFVRTQTYFARLCLVQVATDDRIACIDLLAGLDTTDFCESLTAPDGLKILHAAKQDLEAWHSTYDRLPAPIFDTQIGAGLLGHAPQVGYARIVEDMLGIQLKKGQTRTDWSRRPLTAAQSDYAVDDVRYLQELHARQREQLENAGRYAWALEDSESLTDTGLYESRPADAWRRLPKIAYMPVPMQSRARRLAVWREQQAKKADRPRQWILSDKALLDMAENDPRDQRALSRTSDLPPGVVRKRGKALLEVIRRANEDVANDRVEFEQLAKPRPPDPKKLGRLAQIVSQTAEELGITAEILATRRDLTAILRGQHDVRPLFGWRKTILGDRLLEAV